MAYELSTEKFSGPLEKLLELIEDRKLQISEISLAEVTNDFLKYLEQKENIEFSALADFISIASRLILIKSKSLLPDLSLSEEEESDIKDLEKRLALYQEFKSAKKHFEDLWNSKKHFFARQYMGGMDAVRVFYPGTRITKDSMLSSLGKIFASVKKITQETELIREKIVSLEEKIQEVILRVQEVGETSLNKLSESKNKSEMVVIFLAILHLAREQLIRLEQTSNFSDIMIKRNEISWSEKQIL